MTWIKDKGHNPTEFTQDLPALVDLGRDFRKELLAKASQNPEQRKTNASSDLIMGMCVHDYGMFSKVSEQGVAPTESDYTLHFSLCLLRECCLHEKIPALIPRMLLNNIAIKLSTNEL